MYSRHKLDEIPEKQEQIQVEKLKHIKRIVDLDSTNTRLNTTANTNSQNQNLNSEKIIWINEVEMDNTFPCIYLANEFFDALPIKQFFKKENNWFERYVNLKTYKKAEFNDKEVDIKIIEEELKLEISKDQEIIEYSQNFLLITFRIKNNKQNYLSNLFN